MAWLVACVCLAIAFVLRWLPRSSRCSSTFLPTPHVCLVYFCYSGQKQNKKDRTWDRMGWGTGCCCGGGGEQKTFPRTFCFITALYHLPASTHVFVLTGMVQVVGQGGQQPATRTSHCILVFCHHWLCWQQPSAELPAAIPALPFFFFLPTFSFP